MNEGVPTREQFDSVMPHISQEAVCRINQGRCDAGIYSLFDPPEAVKLRNEWVSIFDNERKQLNNLYFGSKTALPESDPETKDEVATPQSASGKDMDDKLNNTTITCTETSQVGELK